jgi:hypothetical protein
MDVNQYLTIILNFFKQSYMSIILILMISYLSRGVPDMILPAIIGIGIRFSYYVYCLDKSQKTNWKLALVSLIPGFGQIGVRLWILIKEKNFKKARQGWWFLIPIFFLPPFSLIPAYYIYNDMKLLC